MAGSGWSRWSCAEEFQRVWSALEPLAQAGGREPWSSCSEKRRVGAYYFYILDPEFGPGFIKICTYAP